MFRLRRRTDTLLADSLTMEENETEEQDDDRYSDEVCPECGGRMTLLGECGGKRGDVAGCGYKATTAASDDKVQKVMHEFKTGKLRLPGKNGKPGAKVTSRKQALAIALSEAETAALEPSVVDTTEGVMSYGVYVAEDAVTDVTTAAFGRFDESKHRRKPKGSEGGGQFTVKENAAGRFEVVDDETGKKVAEATSETDAQVLADEKNALVPIEGQTSLLDDSVAEGPSISTDVVDDVPSPEYMSALAESNAESAKFTEATRAYRAQEIGDDEYLAARARYKESQARFDEVFAREQLAPRGELASADQADAIVASIPVHPPSEWFANPELEKPTAITVTADGQIYGHAALWGTCHIGNPRGAGVCVQPPRSQTDYGLFHLGELETEDGARVPVGQITLDTGHAPLGASARTAAAHYDDTGSVVADVTAGEDEHGIYFAGALRPDATPEKVRKLLAAKISGDWRGGELVGMLAVNVPGFPVPRTKARLVADANGTEEVLALVAAGIVGERELDARELEIRVQVLAARAEGGIAGLADLAER